MPGRCRGWSPVCSLGKSYSVAGGSATKREVGKAVSANFPAHPANRSPLTVPLLFQVDYSADEVVAFIVAVPARDATASEPRCCCGYPRPAQAGFTHR